MTSKPLVRRTFATLRRAEFGFFGVVVIDAGANAALLRRCAMMARLFPVDFLLPRLADQLADRRHTSPFQRRTRFHSEAEGQRCGVAQGHSAKTNRRCPLKRASSVQMQRMSALARQTSCPGLALAPELTLQSQMRADSV